mmetsp:Transcript_21517/g.31256  ORF Transcript_21517/g.31256 Transcript_21517/m.31256 type:complete len:196 (+) Transcript_21517:63-650(+)|eukprot:CAMPEP_0185020380 /NCGR_PEP_ID=MMETSP1103-20130426/2982_1 /TAXON_ID=36769 /ORGANISM="Paraphysomonas bandaiensis, Strain Caron Lab Isolate" /LENGTH=195 /DNA_ID=CAMNT_0027551245 /DNA_START=63 /DNA_END=650 /DNA_ORIENTATION=-
MDFESCYKILEERMSSGAHSACVSVPSSSGDPCSGPQSEDIEFSSCDDVKLVDAFLQMQGERVQVYTEFDTALQVLLSENRISEYTLLCAEVTARFKAISNTIISIQRVLENRSMESLARCIADVQRCESQKLVLVAAKHLDLIRDHNPALADHIGVPMTQADSTYATGKILECESRVRSLIEDIQCEKCDLLSD